MGRRDQDSLSVSSPEVRQDDMNGINGQYVTERSQVLLTLGASRRLGLTDEVSDQVKVAFSIREAFLFRVPERQPLHD